MLVVNLIAGILFVLLPSDLRIFLSVITSHVLPAAPMYIIGILSLLNFVFVISMFDWKRIGFYGIVAASIVTILVYLIYGFGAWSLTVAIWPIILYLLVRRKKGILI